MKLEGIVGSEFVHIDYGEAIRALERANEKFEFPVKWGIDLQLEHERTVGRAEVPVATLSALAHHAEPRLARRDRAP